MFQFEKFYGFPHSVNLFSKNLFLSWICFGFLSLETDAQRFAACGSGGLGKPKLSVKH
ncbi:hypothetical protein LIS90_12700 [Flavobacterium psychrophilum]|uniref:hypothetical protein n=1 Tax=Flavobacterium psychrophilum TaxID=96345 RepID=UPI001D08DB90|nr:hypothetical protein [Flavobacterium psychrophilum]MCB6232103.1 hypothetical protein [Flavobacterium psychrophilum]